MKPLFFGLLFFVSWAHGQTYTPRLSTPAIPATTDLLKGDGAGNTAAVGAGAGVVNALANPLDGTGGLASYAAVSAKVASVNGATGVVTGSQAVAGANIFPNAIFATNGVTAPSLAITAAANGKRGTFTLASGTVTVTNTSITGNSVIQVTVKTVSGTRSGNPTCVPTAGTGFVATGGGADNSTYNYIVIE